MDQPLPKLTKEETIGSGLRLHTSEYAKARAIAARKGISFNRFVREATIASIRANQ